MIIALLLLLLVGLNLTINYIARRDKEEAPPLQVKLWLIPVLSLLIIAPLSGFTLLYAAFFKTFELTGKLLFFSSTDSILTFSLTVLLGFLFFETLVHPLLFALIRYQFKKQFSIYTKQAVTILVDSLIIYWFASTIYGVGIKDFYAALSISVFYHIFQWILMSAYKCYKICKGSAFKK
ncbi:hypothetical protein D3C78_962790 [compost metagenome]